MQPSGYRLTFADREDIACLRAEGLGVREIARRIGRPPSTVSRGLRRACVGRRGYRASTAQAEADVSARRPKVRKLVADPVLCEQVRARLSETHSPQQVAARLRRDFPEDVYDEVLGVHGKQMRVSHETIDRALYVQGRGGLREELRAEMAARLRGGRQLRRAGVRARAAAAAAAGTDAERRGRIPGMVNISARPPEAADRAVPGHWEGDLIIGKNGASAIGTLVERATRFVMLLHLPTGADGRVGYTALAVQEAMIAAMADLPATLKKTLTWDQGKEMTNHARITEATGLQVFFCDPHSPWQRGSNENTNGLLRQYFPKGTDLSVHGPGILAMVASELNRRPRQTLDWDTPAEALDKLLSSPTNPDGVALTG